MDPSRSGRIRHVLRNWQHRRQILPYAQITADKPPTQTEIILYFDIVITFSNLSVKLTVTEFANQEIVEAINQTDFLGVCLP